MARASQRGQKPGYATFAQAREEILAILADGREHERTAEIGRLSPWVRDHMFGKVEKDCNIQHRRVGGGQGSYVVWYLGEGLRSAI